MTGMTRGRLWCLATAAALLAVAIGVAVAPAPAGAVEVATGAEFTAAWNDLTVTEITLTADVEVGCEDRSRTSGSPAIGVDGQGHTVTVACDDAALGGTTQTLTAMTLSDLTFVGPTADFAAVLRAPAITLVDVRLVGRNNQSTIMHVGSAEDLLITGSDLEANGSGYAVETTGRARIEATSITGPGSGIASSTTSPLEIVDSTISVDGIGILADTAVAISRSSIGGGFRSLSVQGVGSSTITDTTILTGPGPDQNEQAAISAFGAADLLLDQVTVIPDPEVVAATQPAILVGVDATLVTHASVLVAPPDQDLCGPGGTITSLGDDVTTDDTCGLDGAGDRVLADPGLEAYDPEVGAAAPVIDGPLVDAVEECTTSSDQLGLSRPQGPACDIGAIELEVDELPPTSSSSVPADAAPASAVVGDADFTG